MFQEIEKGSFFGNKPMKGVNMSCKNRTMRITIDQNLYRKLGRPDFVKVLAGSGDDEGKVAIVKVGTRTQNAYTMNEKTRSVSFSVNRIGMTASDFPVTYLPFELTEQGLVVDMTMLMGAIPMVKVA